MDIVNWVYLKRVELIKNQLNDPSDLILLGADVGFDNRGDKYLSYAMTVANFVDAISDIIGPGSGTVTSIDVNGGTGISVSPAGPITTSGTFTVTNTAPDQVVVLNGAGGTSITGIYPNFTISSSGGVAVQFNGAPVSAAASTLNFVGTNITSVSGDPVVTITIPQVPLIFKSTAVGTTVQDTLSATTTYSVVIPANTVTSNSIIRISFRILKDEALNSGDTQLSIRIGPDSNINNATTIGIADVTWTITDPNRFGQMKRELVYDGTFTKCLNTKAASFTDEIEALSEDIFSINWTSSQTILFAIQHLGPLNITDSAAGSFYCVEIY